MVTKADFIGFEFAGKHSSDLGIIRTSDGDRFSEQLTPEIKDITVEVPGMHGEYFFGSTYGNRTFEVQIAYDHLTEEQFREMRKLYGRRNVGELIFDERPYKKYLAKIESPIELSYVCFDEPIRQEDTIQNGIRRDRNNDNIEEKSFSETVIVPIGTTVTYQLQQEPSGEITIEGISNYTEENGVYTFVNDTEEDIEVTISYQYEVTIPAWEQITPYKYLDRTERIYKGDGSISFICYFPFAKSVYKQIPNTEVESDWVISSGILTATEYATIDKYNNETGIINVYNAGDVPTGFCLYIPFDAGAESTLEPITLTYKNILNAEMADILSIEAITKKDNDVGILIDTNNGLIVGVKPQLTTETSIVYDSQTGALVNAEAQNVEVGITYDINGNAQYSTSGNIYNEYVEAGDFFKLQPNLKNDGATIEITGGKEGIEIFYDYLYF